MVPSNFHKFRVNPFENLLRFISGIHSNGNEIEKLRRFTYFTKWAKIVEITNEKLKKIKQVKNDEHQKDLLNLTFNPQYNKIIRNII